LNFAACFLVREVLVSRTVAQKEFLISLNTFISYKLDS
jgi:hypothetical protein